MIVCFFTLPVMAKNTILVLGDSLSAGYGISVDSGWVKLLQRRIDDLGLSATVINASVSGDTTSQGLARLSALMSSHAPTIVVVELGGNDGLRAVPLSAIQKNLQAIISAVKEADASVVLVGVRLPPNYGADYTNGFHQLYKTLAAENDILYVPSLLAGIEGNRESFQPDGIHPVASVQGKMLENVWVVLKPIL
jgi:acyl-CoA thioesterase-1